jgi:hypothetical protein
MNNELFLNIPSDEQSKILKFSFRKLGKSEQILEKDIWVCWTLQKLFSMPNAPKMAFKGGTSLSKVFNAIFRFSEDVDITIDYRNFITKDLFSSEISNTQLKKISEQLKELLKNHVTNIVMPYLETSAQRELGKSLHFALSANGEQLKIHYPTVLNASSFYINPSVLIEFGARNITDPFHSHRIKPEIESVVASSVLLPVAEVNVLIPERTFWEKVTLIHVECNRGEMRENADRLARHWYDLSMLYRSDIGKSALKNKSLLLDVVKHKQIFYNSSYAKYDQCLAGKFNLIPRGEHLQSLIADYENMINSKMFYEKP